MSALSRQERLRRRTEETMAGYARAQAERERRRDQPLRPGDLFVFAETAEFSLQWAAIDRDPEDERRLLVVPADLNPLVGSADVATPAGSACGALSLRCGFEVWLEAGDFDLEMRTGFLEPALLDRARRKRAEIAGGDPIGSARERETDAEPEYQDVAKVLTEARTALLDSRPRRVEQPGKVLPFRPPTRWGSLGSPYAIAASVLLAVTLGLSGGMVWQSQELGKVVHELGVREQAHRQELAERAQERQRREQTHRRVIAGLTEEGERAEREYRRQLAELERLGSGGRQQPLVDLPFAWLTPEEEVRGEIKTISVPSAASYFALILEVSDPQPYPAYRLEIRDDANTKVWSSELSKTGISEVSVALPRRLLAAGEYRLRLYGPGDGQLVEEYPLRMELE